MISIRYRLQKSCAKSKQIDIINDARFNPANDVFFATVVKVKERRLGEEMPSINQHLESIIEECGGFGKFQWIVITITFMSKISCTWSILMMQFGGATPDWWHFWHKNYTSITDQSLNNSQRYLKTCDPPKNHSRSSTYSSVSFANDKNTIVNEWELICDKEWVISTITTIQMGGLLLSGIMAGQLADTIGRKPTYFLSLFILVLSNLVAGFSTSWKMFAALRFIIGVGSGIYLATVYIFMIEFTPLKFRPMICALPDFPIFAACYGLVAWWLHDWKYLHFATAVVTAPTLLGIFFIPESFRWLVSHDRIEAGDNVIQHIADTNGRKKPNIDKIVDIIKEEKINDRRYSVFDIFRSRQLVKISSLLWLSWLACGYSYYAITFGVEQLSGSLYLNIFLLSAVEIPGSLITWFLNNVIGRRWTCFLFFMIATLSGGAVGIVQVIEPPNRASIVNVCALIAKLGVAAGWPALMTFTTELYPTVIRNIAYGFLSSISRVGAMIAPQIVHLSNSWPGLLYFLFSGCMLLSAVFSMLLPETKGKALEDQISIKTKESKQEHSEIYI